MGVRRGRREEFAAHGWGAADVPDPLSPATAERSTLDWEELSGPAHRQILELYRALIALRHRHPELADPRLDRFRVEAGPGGRWLVLHRGPLRLACNLADGWDNIRLDRPAGLVLLASADIAYSGRVLEMPPESFALVTTEDDERQAAAGRSRVSANGRNTVGGVRRGRYGAGE
jgi:maltooligosyltrehalose trehalohydrolase